MKKIAFLGVFAFLNSFAFASSPAYTTYANQLFIKARATKAPCDVALGKSLSKAMLSSLGSTILCATTKYAKDDTKDFIDINFNDDMQSPWEDGKNFTSGLFAFDNYDNAIGVLLFNDSKAMVVFDVNAKK